VRPLGSLEAWAGVVAFSFQILFDFSAYTDIARGSARLLGFDIPINFNAPYLARSASDFWRRWHISLSTWLRDYVFIPLGGSRAGLVVTVRNLMITMTLGGLWHGAAWNFVLWGVFWGLALSVERVVRDAVGTRPLRASAGPWLARGGAWMVTQLLVLVGWVFFRAPVADIGPFLGALFIPRATIDTAPVLASLGAATMAAVTAGVIVLGLGVREGRPAWWMRLPPPLQPVALGAAVAIALVLVVVVGPWTGPKFIYFQF
jgi:alginate O-acetyltransferase complex protein AlgI